jgi:hypothetical protein
MGYIERKVLKEFLFGTVNRMEKDSKGLYIARKKI